ncbi:unnamed protein product [Nippostrongylus brasiliensis]|uniref:DUF4147 domain-containing protein n=1 Tax=Nippostrongylus brasiliensis TaxID=27835 RepID=A0A0N4YN27_NIPBR|nr:unnamed protein product [Nippostrongylus brasiliensis]
MALAQHHNDIVVVVVGTGTHTVGGTETAKLDISVIVLPWIESGNIQVPNKIPGFLIPSGSRPAAAKDQSDATASERHRIRPLSEKNDSVSELNHVIGIAN